MDVVSASDGDRLTAAAVEYQERGGPAFELPAAREYLVNFLGEKYRVPATAILDQVTPLHGESSDIPTGLHGIAPPYAPALHIQNLADLLHSPPPKKNWLVQDMLMTGGFSILAARPKAGKSTLARSLGVAVARGDPTFLGRRLTPGTVLYLALEDRGPMFARELKNHGLKSTDPFLPVLDRPMAEDPLAALAQTVAEQRPVLVVIDKMMDLIHDFDSSDYSAVMQAVTPLVDIARHNDTHVLGVHHQRKGGGDEDLGDALLGSTALYGIADHLLAVKVDGEGRRTLSSRNRYGDDLDNLIIEINPDDGGVTTPGTTAQEKDRELEEAILDCVRSHVPATQSDVVRKVIGRNIKIIRMIDEMVQRGVLVRERKGRSNYLTINEQFGGTL